MEAAGRKCVAVAGDICDEAHCRAVVAQATATLSDTYPGRFWFAGDVALGFSAVYLHNVGRNQQQFIEEFAARVLSALR